MRLVLLQSGVVKPDEVNESLKNAEQVVYIKAEQGYEESSIDLIACDADGNILNRGCLLTLNTCGNLTLYPDFNDKLGFELDSNCRIQVDN
jgi:hypothetical protein